MLPDYTAVVIVMLDTKARERGYDNGLLVASYVGSSDAKWATEAQAFVAWRDQIWTRC